MSVGHQRHISKFFSQRTTAYQPELATALGSVSAAIILCQLLYWHTKGKRNDGFVFKTHQDMQKETGLTRSQQDHGLKILIDFDVVEKKLAQIPAKRHFKVDFIKLQKLLPSLKESNNLKYPNPPIYLDDNLQPITKSTQKNTKEITTEITNKKEFDTRKRNLLRGISMG